MLLLFYRGSVAASDFNLAATEASDTFAATVQAGNVLTLAATEQPDTVSATMVAGQAMALAATEAADTFAGELVAVSNDFVLAATEAPDVFAGTMDAATAADAVTTSARFFGLPGPPIERKKEQEEEPLPVVTIDQIAPQISALMEVHEVHSARRAAAQARESAARINRAIALRRTHDAALFRAAQKVALVQEIDRLIAEEVQRVEIEMDDEEVLLLAA